MLSEGYSYAIRGVILYHPGDNPIPSGGLSYTMGWGVLCHPIPHPMLYPTLPPTPLTGFCSKGL